MKVCFIVDRFPSLSETFVLDQISGCLEHGMEVGVLCNETEFGAGNHVDDPRWQNLPAGVRLWWGPLGHFRSRVKQLAGKYWDKTATLLDIADAGALKDFDVIVAHFGDNGLRVARIMRRRPIAARLVTVFHGRDVGVPMHNRNLGSYRVLFDKGTLHLPVNAFFRDALIKAGAPADAVGVHHMGIRPAEIDYRWRSVGNAPLSIISVCRLTEKKGIEFAIRALAVIRDKPWTYSIIGGGELTEPLRALAVSLGIGDRIEFLGPRPHAEVKARLQQANVFLLPSVTAADGDVEGIPVALMEAMAAGLTVVSSVHSGIPELVDDGATGFLAAERDVAGLASRLGWIIDHPEACEPIARAARAKVERDFNADLLNRQFAEIIGRLGHTRSSQ